MQKQFSRNIFLLILINLCIKPLYILGIDAQVQTAVGDQDYGIYFALFNFCFLFQIILDMGIQNYNSREVAQNRDKVMEQFSHVLGTKLILVLAFLGIVAVASLLLGYPSTYMQTLGGVAIIMVLQTFYVYLRSHFSALGHFTTESLLSALDKLLMIIVIGYGIYILKEVDIHRFIVGQIIALCIAIVVATILLGKTFHLSIQFSLSKSKSILRKSLPFALVFVLMTLYTRMDGVMLERLLDDNGASAGAYARGYRLLDAANILGYLFAMLLLPMYAKIIADRANVNPLLHRAMGLLITLATITTLGSWYYAEEIMHWIYGQAQAEHIQVFRLLMVSFWFMSMAYVFGALITASGRLKIFNLIFCVGIIANWGLNLYWIPSIGAVGAAQATLVTQSVVFLGQWLLAIKRFQLKYPPMHILKTSLFLVITFALFYFISENLQFPWAIKAVITVSLSLFASFLLGFLRLDLANEN